MFYRIRLGIVAPVYLLQYRPIRVFYYVCIFTLLHFSVIFIFHQISNSYNIVKQKGFMNEYINDAKSYRKPVSRSDILKYKRKLLKSYEIVSESNFTSEQKWIVADPDLTANGKLSEDQLKKMRKNDVAKQRLALEEEMAGYNFSRIKNGVKLSNLIMERGGQPIRNIIVTTWQSGSTFIGEALAKNSGSFYYYEPLEQFGTVQIREPNYFFMSKLSLRIISNILNCTFTGLEKFIAANINSTFSVNRRLWQYCKENIEICNDEEFLSAMCRLHPFQLLNTVRFRLLLAKELLEIENFNVRLLLLIRDPRGIMESRSHQSWCAQHLDCHGPERLCMDLSDDYAEAAILRKMYPDRFLAVRYEDISLNLYEGMKKIFQFFRLQFNHKVVEFLNRHSHSSISKRSIGIASKTVPFHWKKEFVGNFSAILNIQEKCKDAMEQWGYAKVIKAEKLRTFNPLNDPPWSEMIVKNTVNAT